MFLKDVLSIHDEPIAIFLDEWAYASIGAFSGAIACGILFHYVSAKWVKLAHGQPIRFLGPHLERILDGLFWLTVASFVTGLACFGQFVTHS